MTFSCIRVLAAALGLGESSAASVHVYTQVAFSAPVVSSSVCWRFFCASVDYSCRAQNVYPMNNRRQSCGLVWLFFIFNVLSYVGGTLLPLAKQRAPQRRPLSSTPRFRSSPLEAACSVHFGYCAGQAILSISEVASCCLCCASAPQRSTHARSLVVFVTVSLSRCCCCSE